MTDASSAPAASSPRFPRQGTVLGIGGTGGLGSNIVRTLVANGADVAVTYHSRAEPAQALAAELSVDGARAQAYQLDLVVRDSIVGAANAVAESLGGIHTVIYAAGAVLYLRYIGQIEPERMARSDEHTSDLQSLIRNT